MAKENKIVNNIDHLTKAKPKAIEVSLKDIDTDDNFYKNLIDTSQSDQVDIAKINSFTTISKSRDKVYDLLDMMCEDPIINAAVEIYTADVCEPNDRGQIVWAESDDNRVLDVVNSYLDNMNVDKNSASWVNSLVRYGDIYLRMFRESEFETDADKKDNKLNEDVIFNTFRKQDHYSNYLELVKNPAEVFDLQKHGKSYGYLKTDINHKKANITGDVLDTFNSQYQFMYRFNDEDVNVYPATEFVHGCIEDTTDRVNEEVYIGSTDGDDEVEGLKFSVKRGKSILYNSFKIWRELNLLKNAILLNRLTRSSIIRTIQVEVGDMEKNDVRNLMNRMKQMVEQKSSISVGKSMQEYTNPGPMENVIYVPTHDGKGAVTPGEIGGDVNVGDLGDLKYWNKQLYASLGIPGQYLGDTDDNTGFNGGTSLALISSRYAKSIKRIQNAYIQALTDAVNLMLIDCNLVEYVNKFTIRMQAPSTQEEKDRKESMSSALNNVQSTLSMFDMIENPQTRLELTKALLAPVVNNAEVMAILQDEIDRMEQGLVSTMSGDGGGDFDAGFSGGGGGGSSAPLDLGGDLDLGGEEGGEELPSTEETGATETGEEPTPEESFYSNRGKEKLNEKDLPSWSDMNLSYTSVMR